jgi:hypothetical protein
VSVAQLVRAPGCGPGCRGFESLHSPHFRQYDKAPVIEKIKGESKNGKISCKQALKLASELDVPSKEIGELPDDLKIKVMGCQLGCFP